LDPRRLHRGGAHPRGAAGRLEGLLAGAREHSFGAVHGQADDLEAVVHATRGATVASEA
jgi:hypothetical protein